MQRFHSRVDGLDPLYAALCRAAETIYSELKQGSGLAFVDTKNETGDAQIGLDVIADQAFFDELNPLGTIRYMVSEERPDMDTLSDGPFSVALDPLDGSKAALVGIPSGAIFGIFENVESERDLDGAHIVAGGFFVFGMHLEMYFAEAGQVFKGIYDEPTSDWTVLALDGPLPTARFCAVNASNLTSWDDWFRDYYLSLLDTDGGKAKPHGLRWYGSMVSEIKRLMLQGGLFAYPGDARPGYADGHLRLVYEAIPMAFVVEALGGASSNGERSILQLPVSDRHQKTPVFIGQADMIAALQSAKRDA